MRFVDASVFVHAFLKPKRELKPHEIKIKESAKKIVRRYLLLVVEVKLQRLLWREVIMFILATTVISQNLVKRLNLI